MDKTQMTSRVELALLMCGVPPGTNLTRDDEDAVLNALESSGLLDIIDRWQGRPLRNLELDLPSANDLQLPWCQQKQQQQQNNLQKLWPDLKRLKQQGIIEPPNPVCLVNIYDTANKAAYDTATVCYPNSPIMMMIEQQNQNILQELWPDLKLLIEPPNPVCLVNIYDTANKAAYDTATVCFPNSLIMMMMQQQPALRCPHYDSLNTKFCHYNNCNLSPTRHFCKACECYWTAQATSSSHDVNPNETHFNMLHMALLLDKLKQLLPDASLSPCDVVINIPPVAEIGTSRPSFSSCPHPPASSEDDVHPPAVNENNVWLLNKVDPAISAQVAVGLLQTLVGNGTSLSHNARTLLRSSLVCEGLGFALLQFGHLLSHRQNRGFLARFLLKCGYLATVFGLAGAMGMVLPDYLMFWMTGIVCLAYSMATFLS